MRRFILAACACASVTLLGCSLFNGKEGFLDRAAAKDTREGLMITKCTDDVYEKYCKPDPSAPLCRDYCG
jgi:hypothetical protein